MSAEERFRAERSRFRLEGNLMIFPNRETALHLLEHGFGSDSTHGDKGEYFGGPGPVHWADKLKRS